MAPKAGKKAKKTTTKGKGKPKANQTNALLKQVLAALAGKQSARAAPRPRTRRPSQQFPDYFGASRRPYAPEEYLNTNMYEGRKFARMNCPAGKIADYDEGECVDYNPFLGRCAKGEYPDPFTGKCESVINPRLGYTYVNGEMRHVGVPMDNSSAWNYAKTRLPSKYPIGAGGNALDAFKYK